jgi:hypothetical protein
MEDLGCNAASGSATSRGPGSCSIASAIPRTVSTSSPSTRLPAVEGCRAAGEALPPSAVTPVFDDVVGAVPERLQEGWERGVLRALQTVRIAHFFRVSFTGVARWL